MLFELDLTLLTLILYLSCLLNLLFTFIYYIQDYFRRSYIFTLIFYIKKGIYSKDNLFTSSNLDYEISR